jgi:hypothetical protein
MFNAMRIWWRRFTFALYNCKRFGVWSSKEEHLIAYGLARAMIHNGGPMSLPDTMVVVIDTDDVAYIAWRRELLISPELGKLAEDLGGTLSVLKRRRNIPQWEDPNSITNKQGSYFPNQHEPNEARPSANPPWAPWMLPPPNENDPMRLFDHNNPDCP